MTDPMWGPSEEPEAEPSRSHAGADHPPASSFLQEVRRSRVDSEQEGCSDQDKTPECGSPGAGHGMPDAPHEDESAAATQPLDGCEPRLVATRPSIDLGCSATQWDTFMVNWTRFAEISELDDESMAPQCRRCLSDQLKDAVDHHRGDVYRMDLDQLLRSVRYVAVEPPIGIRRSVAHQSEQAKGEHFADFVSRVSRLVAACEYKAPCPHAKEFPDPEGRRMLCSIAGCKAVDYSCDVLKNILLSGIRDEDVKKCVLFCPTVPQASPGEIAGLVEIYTRRVYNQRRLEPRMDDLRVLLDYVEEPKHLWIKPRPAAPSWMPTARRLEIPGRPPEEADEASVLRSVRQESLGW